MLAGGGIGPFAGHAFAGRRPVKADIKAASRRVGDVADDPVAALAVTIGEIVTAHCLGMARETLGELGGLGGHGYSSLSRCRPIGDPHQRIAFHDGAKDRRPPDRHEQPQLPGDDLGDEAHRLEPVDHSFREAGDLDAERLP